MVREPSQRDRRQPAGMAAPATTARANVNLALVKYWGKRDGALNLPATGSISLTLDGLSGEASAAYGGGEADRVEIDGAEAAGDEVLRVVRFLDLVRAETGRRERALVATCSTVPRGVGLASSAAAFAALALAASRAAGVALDPPALSALARRGSGSAARSIFGGFVEWRRGERADGRDSVAEPLAPPPRPSTRRGSRARKPTWPRRGRRSARATWRSSASSPSTARSRCTRSGWRRARRSSTGTVRPSIASTGCGS